MKIFQPCVHKERTLGLAKALAVSNITLQVQGKSFAFPLPKTNLYTEDDIKKSSLKNIQILERDTIASDPPDIVILGREDISTYIHKILGILSYKPLLVGYSGNFHSYFDYSNLDAMICTDSASLTLSRYKGTPAFLFKPYFDFKQWPFTKFDSNNGVRLFSFIHNIEKRYPISSSMLNRLAVKYSDEQRGILIKNYSGVPKNQLPQLINDATAILHLKDQEGWGWSVLESLSTGRPIIAHKHLSRDMTYGNWLKEDTSALFFETETELEIIIEKLTNIDYRKRLQTTSALHIREIFDNNRNAIDLAGFCTHLIESKKYISVSKSFPRILSSLPKWKPCTEAHHVNSYHITLLPISAGAHLHIDPQLFSYKDRNLPFDQCNVKCQANHHYPVYGPYINLKPGHYTAEFNLSHDSYIDIFAEATYTRADSITVSSKKQYSLNTTEGKKAQITVDFMVDSADCTWEFRMHNHKNVYMEFRFFGVNLFYISDAIDNGGAVSET